MRTPSVLACAGSVFLLSATGCEEGREPTRPDVATAPRFARSGGPQVTAVDLGPARGHAVNNAGQVVGYTGASGAQAFFWTDADGIGAGNPGVMIALPTPADSTSNAYAVSDGATPQVVGYIAPDLAGSHPTRAVRWTMATSNPVTFSQPAPLDAASSSAAFGVNDVGDVAGAVSTTGCPADATRVGSYGALWRADGTRSIICPLGAPFNHTSVKAQDVNNAGFVVGTSWLDASPSSFAHYRGFVWHAGADGQPDIMTVLPPLSGDVGTVAWSVGDVVPEAQVVYVAGWSAASGGARRPVRWTVSTSGQIVAATLLAPNGWAMGAHLAGHVAGNTNTPRVSGAFFWNATTGTLHALPTPRGYTSSADGINPGSPPGEPIYITGEILKQGTSRGMLWKVTLP